MDRDNSMNPNTNGWGGNNPGNKNKMRDDDEPNYSQFKAQNATYAMGVGTMKAPAGYTFINTGDNLRDDDQDVDTFNVVGTMHQQ